MKLVLDGPRIRLRPPVKADAGSMHKYAGDREIARFTEIPHPYTRRDAHIFIRQVQMRHRRGTELSLGMELKASGELIGMIGLMGIDERNCHAELGYWLAKEYWGQGITVEAVRLICHYGFRVLKLRRIYAHVDTINRRSVRVLEKCGFRPEGTMRKHSFRNRRWLDQKILGLLKEDFGK